MSRKPKQPNEAGARKRFAAALKSWRAERGHPSAYAFFHKCGGKDIFGITYYSYLRIESGQRLPSPETLKILLNQLAGNWRKEYRALLQLYFKALVNGDAFFDQTWEAPSRLALTDEGGGETAALALAAHRRPMAIGSVKQADLLFSNARAFWSFYWLTATGQRLKADALAAAAGLPGVELSSTLQQLEEHKLVTSRRDGSYASTCFPAGLEFTFPLKQGSSWIVDQVTERLSAPAATRGYGFRAFATPDKKTFHAIYSLFREAMEKALLFRASSPVAEGNFHTLEFRVCSKPIGKK